MTSPRRFMQKSMSMSGMEMRSGFRKRSKSNSCCRGSRSVIPSEYETSEPAAEPRPGPTGILRSFAQCFQPPREALASDVLEVAVERIAVRHVKMREGIFNFLQPHTAALGDSEGAREHVRRVFEDSVHLVVTLDIEAGTLELHSVRLLNALAGLNTDHHILRVRVVFAQIMTVVRRYQRQAQIFFQPKQSRMNVVFPFQALVLNLQKEIFFAKNVTVSPGSFTGGFVVVFHQALGHLTFQTAGEPN